MTKRRRFETRGHVRYLTFSCDGHRPLLASDRSKDLCLDYLALTKDRLDFKVYAYVFMPDHVHLLIDPNLDVADVGRILSAYKTRSSTKVLAELRAKGAAVERLWQPGGGYDRNIHSDKEFHEKLDYIESNPVRSGLVKRIEDYRWSSAGSTVLGRDQW